jgi:nucleoside-diphosphate-sugar epimerase
VRPIRRCATNGYGDPYPALLRPRLLGRGPGPSPPRRGWRIIGTSRKPEKRRLLEAKGFTAYPFDRDTRLPPEAFAGVTHVLTSIAPDEAGDPVLDLHLEDLRRCDLAWAGYLGTTAVYGDRGGDWVDETTPIDPTLARADRRARAEAAWLESGLPVHIFRLAGIYGPGRNPFVNLKNGTARRIVKPGQVFSRIHVEDIATVLEASIDRPNPGQIYNVCDDEPAPPQDVVAHAAELMGVAHRPSRTTRPPTSRPWRGPSTRTTAASETTGSRPSSASGWPSRATAKGCWPCAQWMASRRTWYD